VLEGTGVKFNWDVQQAGEEVMAQYGTPMPDHVIESIRKNKVAIKGPLTTPIGTGFRSVNVALRMALDLYANLRPAKTYPGIQSRYREIDLVIVRENTEGMYSGIEAAEGSPEAEAMMELIQAKLGRKVRPDSAISVKTISITGSRRIVKFAFDYARANGRKKVTAVHKANIMKFTDGLFLEVSREVAKEYPEIEFGDLIIDNCCMQLVQKPEMYDVLVMPNLYGDITSDLCAGLVGGLGVAPGANIGNDAAVFEATHGSAPKYKGQNKVNPTAMILSGKLMLEYLEEWEAAQNLENAVATVIKKGDKVTYDLKPDRNDPSAVGTSEYADAIIEQLGA